VGTKEEKVTPQYCRKLRDEILVKLRLGESAPLQNTKSMSLDDVATEYFNDMEDTVSTKKRLKVIYMMHLKTLANEMILDIDDEMIKKLRRIKSKEVSAKTERLLAPSTVNNILLLLSAIMNFAKKKGYVSNKPSFSDYVSKVDNGRTRYLDTSEVKLLLTTIIDSGLPTAKRLELFVKVSLRTGGRISSITNIKGKDINRTNRTVELWNFKTNKAYTAFISKELMKQIPPLKPHDKLFDITLNNQIQRPLQGILNDLFNVGLNADDRKDRVVIHTLRHTFASHLAINNTPICTIMKLMNHSDINMTLRYVKLGPDGGRMNVENLYE